MALKRWAIPSFTIDTDTLLIEGQAGEQTITLSILISNNEAADDATITFTHTDTDGTTPVFSWHIVKTVDESPTVLDSVVVLEPGDKILVQSNKANVSVLASGEAK